MERDGVKRCRTEPKTIQWGPWSVRPSYSLRWRRGQKCCPATLSSGHSNSHQSQDQKTEEGVVSETGQCLPEAAAIELWGMGHPLLVAIMALFGPPSPSGPSLAEPSEKIEAKGGGIDIEPQQLESGRRKGAEKGRLKFRNASGLGYLLGT